MGSSDETLQGQVEEQADPGRVKYGTFSGVWRPVFMTIVGVIMFVRESWIVGNAGLLGGWLIIVIGFAIVTLSAMSMSCITTNIRIGAGGAFSMISKSLGLEVGGSVGFPLYLAQAFAGAMYIFGFREGLVWAVDLLEKSGTLSFSLDFLSPIVLDLISFALMFGIALISTTFAFNVQYVVLVVLIAGIVAFFLGPLETGFPEPVTWWGEFQGDPDTGFQGTNFWALFAIFFPAATGILAGANLSGDLKEPRKSIPRGTLGAIFASFLVYMAVAYFAIRMAPVDELVSNYYVVIEYALWPPAVLGALLGATFSSGLACFVGAPRILQALADHEIIPFGHDSIAKLTPDGEPRNALLVTGVVVLGAILIRDLNAIAPMITMFFLITYMMLNFVVLVEQSLEMVSFRPTFSIPKWIPLTGTVGCLLTMIVISPVIGVTAVVIVIGLYFYLTRRQLVAKHGDMRSGLFVALAEWAARRTYQLPSSKERAWKPNLMVPFSDPRDVRGISDVLENIAHPNGSLYLIGCTEKHRPRQDAELEDLGRGFMSGGVFTRWTIVEGETFDSATISSLQTLAGEFLRPNILFLRLPDETDEKAVQSIVRKAREYNIGVQIYMAEPRAQLGRRSTVNVWIRDQSPKWELTMDLGNLDLAMLTAFKLQKSWGADVRLVTAVPDAEHVEQAEQYLRNLLDLARFPDVEVQVHNTDFGDALDVVPHADVELLGLPERPDYDFLRMMVDKRKSTCLFVADSGDENILA